MDTGFLAVTDLEACELVVTGSPSLGQPLDTAIRCLKMSRPKLPRVSHVIFNLLRMTKFPGLPGGDWQFCSRGKIGTDFVDN